MRRIFFVYVALTGLLAPKVVMAQEQGDDFGLSALDSLLSLPVASAAKYNQQRPDVAAAVSVITSDEIEAYGFRTLADVFQTLPGFYVSDDLNYTYVGARGFSRPSDYNNRMLVLLDGHTMNEPFYGSAVVGTTLGYDLATLDRIEIVRGPGSALYGTSAMFAVVNLISKTSAQVDGLRVGSGVGSLGTREALLMLGKEFDGGLNITASANWSDVQGSDRYYAEFDDPSTNFGIAEERDWDRSYAARTSLSYGAFRFDVAGASRSKGIPTAPWDTEFNNPDLQTEDRRLFAEASVDLDLSESKRLAVRGFFDHYDDSGVYPYDSNWIEESESNSFGSEVSMIWDLSPNNRLVGGLEGQVHSRASFNSFDADQSYFGGDFPFEQGSVYVQDELQLGPAGVTLGLRYDAYSVGGDAFSPRAAFLYHANEDATLKLLYGRAFRVPTVYEREYNAVDEQVVNPNLGPESVQTFEVAWEQRLGRSIQSRISAFHYDLSNLIDYADAPSDPGLFIFDNVASAAASGLELEFTGAFVGGITGYASYTLQDTRDEVSATELSNSPDHMVKLGFSTPLPHVILGSNIVYESGRMTVQDTSTDSHFLLDLTLSSRTFADGLSVKGSVRNVFDTEYRTPGGWEHTQAAIPQYGRRFYLELQYQP